MVSSSIFLFISYFRLGMSLPILESKQKKYDYSSALNFEKNIRNLTVKDEFNAGIENYNDTTKNPLSLLPNYQKISNNKENKNKSHFNKYNNKNEFPFVS